MRKLFVICVIVATFVSGLQVRSHAAQLRETGHRMSLTNGNELYGWCRTYRETVRTRDGQFAIPTSDTSVAFDAGSCMAYVRGVVDSTPAGDTFDPNSSVRVSQYVDVVFRYLDAHPEERDQSAGFLAQNALTQAFPKREGR